MPNPPRANQGRSFNYDHARQLLAEVFGEAEGDLQEAIVPEIEPSLVPHFDLIFASTTQSFREGLLGCVLVRNIDATLNIRYPYVNQSDDAFNGRSVDEEIVNPLLQDRMIPCSKGPYLATFRRGFKYTTEKAEGYRDKKGYAALMAVMDVFEKTTDARELRGMLRYLLYRFILMREGANIPLSRIHRLSLEQYDALIGGLLQVPSGGLLPVLVAVALFETIRLCLNPSWEITTQGINFADSASSAGGDITVKRPDGIMAVEVTERRIDASRVVSTFNTKIAPHGIGDYLYLYTETAPTEEARATASRYFAQGHELAFLQIRAWVVNVLGILGPRGRAVFTGEFLKLLDTRGVPVALKVAWNDRVKALLGSR